MCLRERKGCHFTGPLSKHPTSSTSNPLNAPISVKFSLCSRDRAGVCGGRCGRIAGMAEEELSSKELVERILKGEEIKEILENL